MSEKPLPCSRCKNEPVAMRTFNRKAHFVMCRDCKRCAYMDTKAEAIETWNKMQARNKKKGEFQCPTYESQT
jgi:hypothetical protein